MRVIFLTHNYPRHAGDPAGGFLHPLAVALAGRGHDVRVVAPSDHGRGGTDVLDGIPVVRVRYATAARERYAYSGTMQTALRSPAGLLALARLRAALRGSAREAARGGPSVVHAHWWVPAGWAAPPELATVLTIHGTDGRLLERSRLARWMGRPVVARAQVVTAVSHSLAAGLARTCGRTDVRVQPMPVATDLPWTSGTGGLLIVTRLVPQKRVGLALEVLRILQQRGTPLPATIVGDGPERAALEEQARAAGLPVEFTGALPFDRVRALLATARLALQPSVAEGYGLAAAEAIMAGIPTVVCTDGGGLLDAVPGQGAGRRAAPTAEAIALAVDELRQDAGAPAAARAAGTALRERLAPDAVARVFEGWYHEATAR